VHILRPNFTIFYCYIAAFQIGSTVLHGFNFRTGKYDTSFVSVKDCVIVEGFLVLGDGLHGGGIDSRDE